MTDFNKTMDAIKKAGEHFKADDLEHYSYRSTDDMRARSPEVYDWLWSRTGGKKSKLTIYFDPDYEVVAKRAEEIG